MKTPPLKPCPFCGGKAKLRNQFIGFDWRAWFVGCANSKCAMRVETRASDLEGNYRSGAKGRQSAIIAWNTRS